MGRKKKDWNELPEGYEKYKAYLKSDEWKSVQEQVIANFEHRCAACGRTEEQLYIHHNTYSYLYKEMQHITSVIPLCKVCHIAIHRIRRNWKQFNKPKKE